MTHSDYFRRPSGQTLYAKPLPLVVAPWADDALAAVENASTGSYEFSELADDCDHEIFRQLGVAPASSDSAVGVFSMPVDTSGIDLLLERVTGLMGPNIVAITVTNVTNEPIQQARVRLTKTGDTQSLLTDGSGLARFACESGTWTVVITASGYASQLHTIAVSSDVNAPFSMVAIVVSEPAIPQLCVLRVFARHNGVTLQGAVCKARLKAINSAIDGTVLSTQITQSVTDSDGYGELQLIRASEFVDGDGLYVIEVWHGDRRFVSVTASIPNLESINLEDLIGDSGV